MILLLGMNLREGISSIVGDRYVNLDENKKYYLLIFFLYGHSMSQPLSYDEIFDDRNVKLKDMLNTADNSNIGYFIEVDLFYPDNIKKLSFFLLLLKIKKNPENVTPHMNKMKPNTCKQSKKLICDWTDEKNYLVQYRMLNFYVRHGMVVDKVHEIFSFKPSKCLGKCMNFKTQKRNQPVNDFEKDFCKLLKIVFFGITTESVRNWMKIEFIRKDESERI